MDVHEPDQSERTKGLPNGASPARCIVCSVVHPISLVRPHHGIIVGVVFPWVIRIGHIKRVTLARLKRPFPVGIVVVIVCSANHPRRPIVHHSEFVEIIRTSAVVCVACAGRVGDHVYRHSDRARLVLDHHI